MIGSLMEAMDYTYANKHGANSPSSGDNTGLLAFLILGVIVLSLYVAWVILKCLYWICVWFYYLIFPSKNPINKKDK